MARFLLQLSVSVCMLNPLVGQYPQF